MSDTEAFAARIRQRFPEGLTAVFAVGGTRTTYILEHNRAQSDPGKINFSHYSADMLGRIRGLIDAYLELGGQNLIIPVLSYQSVNRSRGSDYADYTARLARELMSENWVIYYQSANIDPYFTGIDTLLHFENRPDFRDLGAACAAFNQAWPYRPGRHKLIWEIAPIPLYSFWRAGQALHAEAFGLLDAEIAEAADLQSLHDTVYAAYSRAAYGTDLPVPHFYLGSNRNGDLKLRAMLPIALLCGSPTRFYFTPYPTLFMTQEALQVVLEDLAFGFLTRSSQTDYAGQLTTDQIQAEYDRVQRLRADPYSTIGLSRGPTASDT